MKVTIIIPQYKPKGLFYELPIGLLSISSSLKKQGHEVKIVNLNTDELVVNSDTILTGGLSIHFNQIKKILKRVRELCPNVKVILGGGLVSSLPDLIYKELSPDLAIIGEGEQINIDSVGLQSMPVIENLDDLPYPDYEGIGIKDYLDRQLCGDEYYLYPCDKPRALPIISSRSCPFNCSFCFHPLGKKYRQRSLDNVFGEIEYLIEKYQINILAVLDELISFHPERLALFCQRIKKYNLKWMAQVRVDSLDEDTVKMMKDSGCFSVSIGIEHINQIILDSYNKHTTLKQIENALNLLYRNNVGIQGNILLGGTKETPFTQREAINWCTNNYKYMINLTAVIPYPGTDLFNRGVEIGKIDPKRYLESDCPYVNFSGTQLQLPILLNPGKVLQKEVEFEDDYRGKVSKVKAICPHCKNIVKYSGLYEGGTGYEMTAKNSYRIGCKICNQRMDLILN